MGDDDRLLPRVFVYPDATAPDPAEAGGAATGLAATAALSEATTETAREVASALTDFPEGAPTAGEGALGETNERWPAARVLARPFAKFWTDAQRRRLELDVLLKQSNLPSSYDKAVVEARRKGAPPPPLPSPRGPVRDEVMAQAFACVAQLAPLLARGDGGDGAPFLWESIWPQQPNGRPAYNPRGVYVVKLWAAGCWRAVVVSDSVPLNHKGECVLPASVAPAELWPLLLAKAAYQLLGGSPLGPCSGGTYALDNVSSLSLAGDSVSSLSAGGVFGFLVATLTGWQPGAPTSLAALAVHARAAEAAAEGQPSPAAVLLPSDEGGKEDDLAPMDASRALVASAT